MAEADIRAGRAEAGGVVYRVIVAGVEFQVGVDIQDIVVLVAYLDGAGIRVLAENPVTLAGRVLVDIVDSRVGLVFLASPGKQEVAIAGGVVYRVIQAKTEIRDIPDTAV